MWGVLEGFVNSDVPAECEIYRFEDHMSGRWVDFGLLAGVTDFS